MQNSDILAQIITTEHEVRELIKTICDKGDYQSCQITTQIWGLLDKLRFRETAHLENEQIENARSTSYHEVVTEEGDPEMLKKALKNIAQAH